MFKMSRKLIFTAFIGLAVLAACVLPAVQAEIVSPSAAIAAIAAPADQIFPLDRRDGPRHSRRSDVKITYEQAEEIALKAVENSDFVKDVDLDYEHYYGGWIYEVEVITKDKKEFEVYIGGETGDVLRVKRDW